MSRLNASQIAEAMQALDSWQLDGEEIRKQFVFEDFMVAMAFVNRVAEVAEAANHHPDIDIRYNKVLCALSTHSEGGLTNKDFELAARMDSLTEAQV
ncbi:MAG: 4a-hydroxytetrahydrobiopterin dehydratase [Abditibacteriota bacterium]|nr:4a-hydroxytetrahydrobiopterin dehydratase [Abditibacteriota bacterium]